jgi:hypothetical protein
MNHTSINYAIGLAALGLAGIPYLAKPATVVQPVQHATASGRINPYVWDGLQQSEVNALQKILVALPKKPVVIFCSSGDCDDIKLDFDNAFESAHWETDIQRPMIDNATGIWTSSQEIVAAITNATGGRVSASLMGPEWKDQDRIALAIGKKPQTSMRCGDFLGASFFECDHKGDKK